MSEKTEAKNFANKQLAGGVIEHGAF